MSDPTGGLQQRMHRHLSGTAEVIAHVAGECGDAIVAAAARMAAAFRRGNKVLLCGNGGSAADCQHMAAELVNRLGREFERPALPAVALTTDTSILTAHANDYGFDGIFARQVEALGQPGDALIGISTSGQSRNVIRAVEVARARAMETVVLVGRGGWLAELADVVIAVPSEDTQHIQEAHLAIEHVLCDLVECHLYEKGTASRGVGRHDH